MDCRDYPYDPSKVTPELRPLFAYLQAELGAEYEIWVRVEDFERRISAGVVNPSLQLAARIPLQQGLVPLRNALTSADIAAIRQHLTSNATKDLVI
jgi:hypothetical protein